MFDFAILYGIWKIKILCYSLEKEKLIQKVFTEKR